MFTKKKRLNIHKFYTVGDKKEHSTWSQKIKIYIELYNGNFLHYRPMKNAYDGLYECTIAVDNIKDFQEYCKVHQMDIVEYAPQKVVYTYD